MATIQHFRVVHYRDRRNNHPCVIPTGIAVGQLCSGGMQSETPFFVGERLMDVHMDMHLMIPPDLIINKKKIVLLLQGRLGDLLLQRGAVQQVIKDHAKRRVEVVVPIYGRELFDDLCRVLTYPVRLDELEDACVIACQHNLEREFAQPALQSIREGWGLSTMPAPTFTPAESFMQEWQLAFHALRQVKDCLGNVITIHWNTDKPLVIMPMLSNDVMRNMPPDKTMELAMYLSRDARVLLTCSGTESTALLYDQQHYAQAWTRALDHTEDIQLLAGATANVGDYMAQLACADLVVTPDTLAYHAAQAMNVPVVGLFCATDSKLRTWNECAHPLQLVAPCAPCWSGDNCPVKNDYCLGMQMVDVNKIGKEILRWLPR